MMFLVKHGVYAYNKSQDLRKDGQEFKAILLSQARVT